MVAFSFMKFAKQPLFPFPWICTVVSQPVRACQLIKAPNISGPSVSYIGCRETLDRSFLMPMIATERSPISDVLRRAAKSCTSVSCEYMWTFIPLLVTSIAWWFRRVSASSCVLDTGHCFTFIIRHNLRRVAVVTLMAL